MKKLITATLLLFGLSGCASVYTNIDKNDDGSYTLTRTKQGFFSVSGNVYRCTESSEGMSCRPLN